MQSQKNDEVTEETAISVMHKRYTTIADILPVEK